MEKKDTKQDTYSIRQIADMFNVPSSTLRYYEEIGLLENVQRTESSQRIYTQEHIIRLRAINCFKETGLSIAKMQDFFKYDKNLLENIDNIISLLQNHNLELGEKIERLKMNQLHLDHKVWFYSEIKKAIDSNSPWPKWEDYTGDDPLS